MTLILSVLMRPPFCHRRPARSVRRQLHADGERAVAQLGAHAAAPRLDYAADEWETEARPAVRLRHTRCGIAPIGKELLRVAVRCDAGGADVDTQRAVALRDHRIDLAAAARRFDGVAEHGREDLSQPAIVAGD